MIKSIELTNFGKHRHLATTFGPGMTALRGANEAGKSTLLRGIAYAMFGTEALPQSLEDTVTWDEEVNTLKVVLKIEVDGVDYTIKRGKSGAELRYEGGSVTGQRDVTRFLCEKMRTDPKVAHYLVLSNQNQIRGALEEGSAKTSQLIEQLARMEELDNIIDMIQSDLPTGSTRAIESVIANAEQTLADAKDVAVPDLTCLEEEKEKAEQKCHAQAQKMKAAGEETTTLLDEARRLQNAHKVYVSATDDAVRAEESVTAARTRLEDVERAQPTRTEDAIQQEIGHLQRMQGEADKRQRVYNLHEKFKALDTLPYDSMPMSTFTKERAEESARSRELMKKLPELDVRVAVLQKSLQDGSCSFCGQDFSNVPQVAQRNKEIAEELEGLYETQKNLTVQLAATQETCREYNEAAEKVNKLLRDASSLGDLVQIDETVFPPTVTWVGGDVVGVDVDYTDKLRVLQQELTAVRQWERRRTEANATLKEAQAALQRANDKVTATEKVTPEQVKAAESAAAEAYALSQEEAHLHQKLVENFNRVSTQLQVAISEAKMRQEAIEAAQGALTTQRNLLVEMQFNNQLLKDVRAARPRVADALWNIVLSSVSTFFSEMRGEESKVTKDREGFKVNGRPVPALSGSTLDILGLAMRVALTRTFLPSAPFIVLDEPAAACDEQRTHKMLAFIAGAGVEQVILCSHDGSSVAVSDAVLELED